MLAATFPQKQQRTSIEAVAVRAGVSVATVSRVLNGVPHRASAATVAAVRAAVEQLGYRPARLGRALREGRTRLVAVLAPNLANPTMTAITASVERALRGAGLVMVVCDTHDRAALQDEYLAEMEAQRARGLVLLGAVDSPELHRTVARGDAAVFVTRRAPGPGGGQDGALHVCIDDRAAGAAVAAHLRERGVGGVGVIHGAIASSATADRIAGFQAGFPRGAVLLAPGCGPADAEHVEIGYHGIDALLPRRRRRPFGVFCTSDLIAYGAHRRLVERGLRVPQDVILVGFDDTPLNDWLAPWLTTVRVPYAEYGAAVLRVLRAQWDGAPAPHIVLPFELVRRGG